jgi:predicted DNA-binding protein with PD1-like motif
VLPTLEVILIESPKRLCRKMNADVGIALIDLME